MYKEIAAKMLDNFGCCLVLGINLTGRLVGKEDRRIVCKSNRETCACRLAQGLEW
jgi:hypothetical protein